MSDFVRRTATRAVLDPVAIDLMLLDLTMHVTSLDVSDASRRNCTSTILSGLVGGYLLEDTPDRAPDRGGRCLLR